MSKGKSFARSLMLLCLSAAFFSIAAQREAAANELTDRAITVNQPAKNPTGLPAIKEPELPPIGEASKFIPGETIRLILKLNERRVYVYRGNDVQASYPVAIGKPGWETPTGTFTVFTMEKNPIFKSFKSGRIIEPGPDNPLGPRWIGIWTDGKTQLGFHGTNEPELIGEAVSHGCIRMHNEDVMALYEQVAVGTPVTVVP